MFNTAWGNKINPLNSVKWKIHLKTIRDPITGEVMFDVAPEYTLFGSPNYAYDANNKLYLPLSVGQHINFGTTSVCDPGSGPFILYFDGEIESFITLDIIAGNAILTRQKAGYGDEYGFFLHADRLNLYRGFYGSNNEEWAGMFNTPITLNTRVKIILQRDVLGNLRLWKDGVLSTTYKHSPLMGSISFTEYTGIFNTTEHYGGLRDLYSHPAKELTIGSVAYPTAPNAKIYEFGFALEAPIK